MSEFELQSNERGAYLKIRPDSDEADDEFERLGEYWWSELSCGDLAAHIRVYDILNALTTPLPAFLDALASDWRGWDGDRVWESIEHDLQLVASHNGLGTVTIIVRMRRSTGLGYRWSAQADLIVDAGALDRIARAAHAAFGG